MQICRSWLQDYIELSGLSDQEIAKSLTSIGLEVEQIETIENVSGEVIVAEIASASKHPDADSLWICQIKDTGPETTTVICGAPNVRQGLRVCFAKVGSSLLAGKIKLKRTKIRGIESCGMLLAEDELGLSEDHSTIIELDESIPIGTPLKEVLPVCETIFHLSITPNRGDCFSYYGIARDLSAKLKKPLIELKLLNAENFNAPVGAIQKLRVEVGTESFSLVKWDNIPKKPSPYWMRKRLEWSGMRPSWLLVDLTNYTMLETGRPIHAYDSEKIDALDSDTFCVRESTPGETFVSLDGKNRQLLNDVIIACGSRTLGLAGIMGGQDSEISETSASAYIEVAHFIPDTIRSTAKRLGLHTEASHRFERGVPANWDIIVQRRIAYLLSKIVADDAPLYSFSTPLIWENVRTEHTSAIALRMERLHQILSTTVPRPPQVIDVLTSLGFECLDQTPNQERLLFSTPIWRHDITREIDLIEEFARIWGFENISTRLPKVELQASRHSSSYRLESIIQERMANSGYTEVILFPFVREEILKKTLQNNLPSGQICRILNPISEQENVYQPHPMFNLLAAASSGPKEKALFQVAKGALWKDSNIKSLHLSNRLQEETGRPKEHTYLSVFSTALHPQSSPQSLPVHDRYVAVLNDVISLLHGFSLEPTLRSLDADIPGLFPFSEFLHPRESSVIHIDNQPIGFCGTLHPKWKLVFDDLPADPIIVSLSLDLLGTYLIQRDFDRVTSDIRKAIDIPSAFPPLTRDLSLLFAEERDFSEIVIGINNFPRKKFLKKFQLLDIYHGATTDFTSFTIRLFFQSDNKTLNEQMIGKEMDALTTHLKETVGIQFR